MIHINTARKILCHDKDHLSWDLVQNHTLDPKAAYWGSLPTKWIKNSIDDSGNMIRVELTAEELVELESLYNTIETEWQNGPGSDATTKAALLEYFNGLPRFIRRLFLVVLPGIKWAIEEGDYMLARDSVAAIDLTGANVTGGRVVAKKAKRDMLAFFTSRGIVADEESPDWKPPTLPKKTPTS